MSDLTAQVACVPKADGGREVLLTFASASCGNTFTLKLDGKSSTALSQALGIAGKEADRVIITPTDVVPS